MAISFRMTFTGLCGFVPRRPSMGVPSQGTVLLVNGDPKGLEDLNIHFPICLHFPQILYRGIWHSLAHKDVEVNLTDPDPAELTIVQIQNPGPAPRPDHDDDRAFHWVADMAAVSTGRVADICFAPDPRQQVAQKVLSRVKLKAGYLSTSEMIEDDNGGDIKWSFRRSGTATPILTRALAAEFLVTASCTSVTLRIKEFGADVYEDVPIVPIGGEAVVQVRNLCRPPQQGEPARDPTVINDFAWFYRPLLDLETINIPYFESGGGVSDTYCPPARFASNSNA